MQEQAKQDFWEGAEIISSYSRAQAIEDGELVDVTETAREAGIRIPTALTRAVWAKYVEVPEGVKCQDEKGRLWDILFMFAYAARKFDGSELLYKLSVRNDNEPDFSAHHEVTLKAICGPGDTPEPVITIMLPDED